MFPNTSSRMSWPAYVLAWLYYRLKHWHAQCTEKKLVTLNWHCSRNTKKTIFFLRRYFCKNSNSDIFLFPYITVNISKEHSTDLSWCTLYIYIYIFIYLLIQRSNGKCSMLHGKPNFSGKISDLSWKLKQNTSDTLVRTNSCNNMWHYKVQTRNVIITTIFFRWVTAEGFKWKEM